MDDDPVQEIIRRNHLADAREAVYLAVRILLDESDGEASGQADVEYEFSDLSALHPRRSSDTG